MRRTVLLGAAALAAMGVGMQQAGWPPAAFSAAPGGVTGARIAGADAEPGQWLSIGRTYDEQRFSPLTQINAGNVSGLGIAWSADLDTQRGQEATPLMIDGKLIVSTAWSLVKAYDAATGKPLWSFDPEVPRETLVKACCDAVNRGVAAWGGKVFVGTLDGRLIAIDTATGKPAWSQVTVDQSKSYTITGAPRVISGKVIIGNGGAEYGVRGYVTAYNADTGKQLWRFYTVPGDPAKGFEGPHLKAAAATWKGEYWKIGGGGTVWDAMAYDPELDLLYIGVGNGSPWNQAYRSPGGGDNLYLSSIVALKPSTGEYVWHYQTTPGETWDFTATQHIMLADLKIDGQVRKVLMQAPKNGFFYVLDRKTGKLLSANNFVPQSWTTGIDMKTGRPIETAEARFDRTGKPAIVTPGAMGAHSWQPMAFDAKRSLVFLPANEAAFPYFPQKDWKPAPLGFNVGIDMAAGAMPADPAARKAAAAATTGKLIAWDPIAQKARWSVQYPGPSNGGVLATAGDLVFQGDAGGHFNAYAAEDGAKLWSMPVQTGVIAAPMSYSIGGQQYVAVLAGWGGVYSLAPGTLSVKSGRVPNISRLIVFKLGGARALPPAPPPEKRPLDPPPVAGTPQQIAEGDHNFGRFCGACHGDAAVAGTLVPDLRHSALLGEPEAWQAVLQGGALKDQGMVSFASALTPAQTDAIRLYVIKRANEDRALIAKGQGAFVQ
ncbi:MAG: PQQ-dependent dehydrogenase, methanol/ethanol family [Sphingomonas fennica]